MYVQFTLNDEEGVPEVYSTPPFTDDADGRAETARVVVDPVGRPEGDRAGVLLTMTIGEALILGRRITEVAEQAAEGRFSRRGTQWRREIQDRRRREAWNVLMAGSEDEPPADSR
ncbi:hypothetical protein [Mycolicibacterium grossiae]|uniref:Uncharacterized protein n=1 Tax=Mycolicibacterium grossiae TaxID=1552759 RepID=A0A1E8PZJ6_9MYCO|nr:hypothetical protein [Mycolicibacterium grossiae]OFJ51546.1 hypothetical protein BEL07_22285 [Mycolicibacterium grossiae]QEM45796.1 hypothetical protein FZ046_14440 [Mycolicibacterium grossiae]